MLRKHKTEDLSKKKYTPIKNDESKINRSTKIRKYASVYKSYYRKTELAKTTKSPRRQRKSISNSEQKIKVKEKNNHKKSLNLYQKFVQTESKKEKYKHLPGKERLSIIANLWKKLNIKT
jgi:hypothetical protein